MKAKVQPDSEVRVVEPTPAAHPAHQTCQLPPPNAPQATQPTPTETPSHADVPAPLYPKLPYFEGDEPPPPPYKPT